MTAIGCAFIGKGTAQRNYAGAPGGSHLKDMWQSCNTLEVVPHSHARLDCRVVVPTSLGFGQKGLSIENILVFVSVSSADKDAEKTF